MKRYACLTLLLAASGAFAFDTDVPGCAEALQHPLPNDAPRDDDDVSFSKDCDSTALFDAGDYAAARRCAWAERANEEGPVFGGAGMLLTLYANGQGVERDFALARRFACEAGGAYAETEGRLAHLQAMESGEDASGFDLCDDLTSGYLAGACAERASMKSGARRDAAWDDLLADWPAAHRAAWKTLRRSADAFFEASVAGEVDTSGSARGAFIVEAEESLAQGLLANVEAFERGELPQGSAEDLAEADRRLNETYAAARAAATPEPDGEGGVFGPLGSITPDGIRDAERAWIKYRDAWVAFGKLRYPAVSDIAWKHHFTLEREKQLREIAGL